MIKPEQRAAMAAMVLEILGPEKANLWWQTPNPMLGGVKPYYMVLMNREESLFSFIDDAYHAGGALQCFSEPQPCKSE